ncbi:DNA-binding transcriptional repressor AcrR [compost metagenome]|uniref:TetR family transcriptional regulator n=1 Tax=Paenibacillus jilunlii TaxID=682956 RepID=A0A1G9NI22_9BACL|nr:MULTISPECIES: TetR/AcrR family transcriptional regulator [Paenibacillus]KWX79063.1 TetR family transcriptional regulator [Paenibacillus jilunlii]MEC0168014.1 TetR/AcrR family transcriptional regulator [Paenibacillus graminis]SDL86238.1 transcriptional regulator, TetR family [Paenibacillus jilunlii]
MKKQPEITEKTRQNFIDVFCELYSQKPIEKISIQEIANKAGYNRSTFYQYFTDIYELLDFVENDLLSYIKEELANKELSTYTVQNALHCLENREYLTVLNALLGDHGSIRFLERLKREITLGRLDLNFPQNHSITPYLIEFHISTSLSLFRLWLQRQKDLSPEEFFELVDNLYTKGVTPYSK